MGVYYSNKMGTLYHGDCFDVLDGLVLSGDGVGAIVTDPPYGVALTPQRAEGKFKGVKVAGDENTDIFAPFLDRAAELTDTIYMFCGWQHLGRVQPLFEAKFNYKNCIVWDKMWIGMGHNWRPTHEFIMYGIKGHSGTLKANDRKNILYHRKVAPQKLTHVCEKPVALLYEIVDNIEKETVLDPFAGSGSTLEAAQLAGHKWLGVEMDEAYCEAIAKRMEAING